MCSEKPPLRFSFCYPDTDVAALRLRYLPNFRKVLPAKKAALYEQVERTAQMLIDVQLASQIPLVQP